MVIIQSLQKDINNTYLSVPTDDTVFKYFILQKYMHTKKESRNFKMFMTEHLEPDFGSMAES